jgi:hypothetical protein
LPRKFRDITLAKSGSDFVFVEEARQTATVQEYFSTFHRKYFDFTNTTHVDNRGHFITRKSLIYKIHVVDALLESSYGQVTTGWVSRWINKIFIDFGWEPSCKVDTWKPRKC